MKDTRKNCTVFSCIFFESLAILINIWYNLMYDVKYREAGF